MFHGVYFRPVSAKDCVATGHGRFLCLCGSPLAPNDWSLRRRSVSACENDSGPPEFLSPTGNAARTNAVMATSVRGATKMKQIIFANKRMCFPFVVGGDGYLIHNVLSYLAANGYDVLHLCPMGSFRYPVALDEILRTLEGRQIAPSVKWKTITHGNRTIPCGRELTYGCNGYQCCLLDNAAFWERLDEKVRDNSPKLIMTALRGAERVLTLSHSRNVPSILWVLDADPHYAVTLANVPMSVVVFDSPFLRAMFASQCRCPTYLIPPIINPSQLPATMYESEQTYVTIINPRRDKGKDIFIQIAASMPSVAFLVQSGRETRDEDFQTLTNVRVLQDSNDLSECFRLTKVLLVCSTCEDAYPTVIPMAHHCGIPVIGSNKGGIPAAIGKGGVVVEEICDTQAWVSAIAQVLNNSTGYAHLKTESRKRGAQLRPDRLLQRLRRVVDALFLSQRGP